MRAFVISAHRWDFYRGADKSLARPARKQTKATKLTFASHLQKIQNFVRPNRSPRQQWPPRRDKKWRTFNCFFSRVGLRTYQHPLLSHGDASCAIATAFLCHWDNPPVPWRTLSCAMGTALLCHGDVFLCHGDCFTVPWRQSCAICTALLSHRNSPPLQWGCLPVPYAQPSCAIGTALVCSGDVFLCHVHCPFVP